MGTEIHMWSVLPSSWTPIQAGWWVQLINEFYPERSEWFRGQQRTQWREQMFSQGAPSSYTFSSFMVGDCTSQWCSGVTCPSRCWSRRKRHRAFFFLAAVRCDQREDALCCFASLRALRWQGHTRHRLTQNYSSSGGRKWSMSCCCWQKKSSPTQGI